MTDIRIRTSGTSVVYADPQQPAPRVIQLTLRERPEESHSRVKWSEDTVNNEHLKRKTSKRQKIHFNFALLC